MIVSVNEKYLTAEPMTKFEYYDKVRKFQIQHPENKRIDGYYCNGLGFKFGLDKETFYLLFKIEDED